MVIDDCQWDYHGVGWKKYASFSRLRILFQSSNGCAFTQTKENAGYDKGNYIQAKMNTRRNSTVQRWYDAVEWKKAVLLVIITREQHTEFQAYMRKASNL